MSENKAGGAAPAQRSLLRRSSCPGRSDRRFLVASCSAALTLFGLTNGGLAFAAAPNQSASVLDASTLGRVWATERFVATPAPCLREVELSEHLQALAARHPALRLEEAGRSVQGRPIHLLTLGRGPTKVMLWSQMHGDEPSATPALLDLAHYLLSRDAPGQPNAASEVVALLDRLTLLMVPMLNPDGAEVYTRRNAQGIDINRDALNLTTPEGRLLKRLRDEHQPILGFNLHDQNRRRTVGDTTVLAANAVLAVTGDKANTLTPGRLLAKRAGAAIAAALEPFAPGGLGRFDETWSPRAFGDNLTAWGTPVVLIESGGVAPGVSLEELTRLNFIALGSVIGELAADGLNSRDPAAYDAIPENNIDQWADVVVRGGLVAQPGSPDPYRADLAFDRLRGDREVTGCSPGSSGSGTPRSEIAELGDTRFFGGGREIDATGTVVVAPLVVTIDGWRASRWLDGPALERLSRLGIARVTWVVAPRHLDRALRLIAPLAGPGRPRVDVTSQVGARSARVLTRLPAEPVSRSLADRLASLEAARRRTVAASEPLGVDARLAVWWPPPSPLPLRYEGPASFSLVRRGGEAEAGTADTSPAVVAFGDADTVELIWLDGVEVGVSPNLP